MKTWTLTDVHAGVWQDRFAVTSAELGLPLPQPWSIKKRTMRGGLPDGIDLIDVDNGAFAFAVLPTRGMGLWRGNYRGHFLGWQAPLFGPVHPKFVNLEDRGGLGWLLGFDEWLCRCGLSSNGPPGEDVHTDANGNTHRTRLTLHGRIANRPAHFVEVKVQLEPPFEIRILGQVEEAGLFYPRLRLTTEYLTTPASNRLIVHDTVENRSAHPEEMQLLYHCNVGAPFLEGGSRVVAPIRELAPMTSRAAEGMAAFESYEGPIPGFAEQVYGYDLLADAAGKTVVLLHNAGAHLGLALRLNRNQLPCFVVWKNTTALEDGYVTGLEPSTNYPNFKSFERQQGRVRLLQPGETWQATWAIEVFDTTSGVAGVREEIQRLQAQATPIIHPTPQSRFSPVP